MAYEETSKCVAALATKAMRANDSGDALRFSQSATNLANALCSLNVSKPHVSRLAIRVPSEGEPERPAT